MHMAAGRHGGHRDKQFREHESGFDGPKGEYDGSRSSGGDDFRGQIRDGYARGRGRVRQKDVKEREVFNEGYRPDLSRSRSNSDSSSGGSVGLRLSGGSVRVVDREPGELSSESDSDQAIDSESLVGVNGDLNLENGNLSPLGKKRKFSPIVWDKDSKEAKVASKSRTAPSNTTLPPRPPPESCNQSLDLTVEKTVQISFIESSKLPSPEPSLVEPFLSAAEVPAGLSSSSPGVDNQEAEQLDVENHTPTRNISSSRWADEVDSPADEGEIFEVEEVLRRRKKFGIKLVSPELGELRREGSEGTRGRSSEIDGGGFPIGSSSSDDSIENDLDKNDHMEIDRDYINNDTGVSQSNSDSDMHDSRGTPEPAAPLPRSVNMLQGCRSVDVFERLNKIDEGTYGVVYRARDKKTDEIVALKKVKMEKEREGFPLTSLREINILLSFHHPSIVDVKEVVVGSNLDSIFMVMEYMEHDLKGLMETIKQPYSQSEVKCLMLQLFEGVKYLHDNWVLHRDLKTSNLLLNNRGELKICDFGLARQYGSPLKPYTHLVVTLWYRAPELLLGAKQYSTAIDMWSLGCIMAELLSKKPLFNGKTEVDQLDKIFRILGTPNETIWPGFSKLPGVKVNFVKHQYNMLRKKFPATSFTGSPVLSDAGFDLLNKLLTYDPEQRITAEEALNHEWFREVPLPKSKDFMPTFPAQHAQDRRMRRVMKSPDPLEEQRRKELQQGDLGARGIFG